MRSTPAAVIESVWYGDSLLKWPLAPLSVLFRGAAALRAAAYRGGFKRVVELPVPVIVAGNITAGGTGKTPFVIWLAGQLEAAGLAPGIVTRGYRGRARGWPQRVLGDSDPRVVGDEPVLLAARTGRPVAAAPDRVAAGELLVREAGVDVLVADDGLQHYRMARAFEIAIIDAKRGFGNGWPLPAGPLREPVSRLASVDAVIVNGGFARPEPRSAAPAGTPALTMGLAVRRVFRLIDGQETTLAAFAGRSVHAMAGIAHPERFFSMLEQAGIGIVRHPLRDHAEIGAADLRPRPAAPVLLTEKDAVKCRAIAHEDVWCVAVDAVLGQEDGRRLLDAIVARLEAVRQAGTRR